MRCIIEVCQGSLTAGQEDVLVNASNTNVRLGSGVSHAIRLACGDGYQEHIEQAMLDAKGGYLEPGDVFMTDAGAHPHAKHVAHVAVMDYRHLGGNTHPDEARLKTATDQLWTTLADYAKAQGDDDVSVAMVALGAGTGGAPISLSIGLACTSLKTFLASNDGIGRVRFYAFLDAEFAEMQTTIRQHFDDVSVVELS